MEEAYEQQIDEYLKAVLQANNRLNLTRITDYTQARVLHVEDSLAVVPELLAAPDGRYADLGSGAGFPGVPLALATQRPVLLVESVGKKCRAVEEIIRSQHIEDLVSMYSGRSENLAREEPAGFDVITARALAALPSLLELASPLLRIGGRLICLKGPGSSAEAEWACKLERRLGMRLQGQRDYVLSDRETQRSVFVFEKVSEPEVSLPRRPGAAQSHPYKQ